MPESSPPVPDAESLRQAALSYLARYAATRASLRRTLERRIQRWARVQPDADAAQPILVTARAAADAEVERLAAIGAVSDAAFAESRARSLVQSGRSRRSVAMRLAAKGIEAELAQSVLSDDPEVEFAAALVLARKRRIGPFRTAAEADRPREFGILARAGFSRDITERTLGTDLKEAEDAIHRLRQG